MWHQVNINNQAMQLPTRITTRHSDDNFVITGYLLADDSLPYCRTATLITQTIQFLILHKSSRNWELTQIFRVFHELRRDDAISRMKKHYTGGKL